MTKNELSERVKTFRSKVEAAAQTISDENVESCVALFPHWEADGDYSVGYRVQHNGIVYKCLQAHAAQESWSPESAPSLWAKVLAGIEDAIAEWERPDSTNTYMKGDKVSFNGKIYESTIDYNSHSPTEYPAGWKEV